MFSALLGGPRPQSKFAEPAAVPIPSRNPILSLVLRFKWRPGGSLKSHWTGIPLGTAGSQGFRVHGNANVGGGVLVSK